MKITVDGKYRRLVKLLLGLTFISSVAISFFVLPTQLAVLATCLLTTAPLVLDRFIFEYKVMHIMPMPTVEMLTHGLGTSWYVDDPETMEGLGLVMIYKYKHVAKDAFKLLKAWNYGKVIDLSENIAFRGVREGGSRYSVFIFPGDRTESLQRSEQIGKESFGEKTSISLNVIKPYLHLCFDYSADDLKTKCIEALPYVAELNLNVGYVNAGEIHMYSKRGFRLRNFTLKDRTDIELGPIEESVMWDDPLRTLPEIHKAMIDKVNQEYT